MTSAEIKKSIEKYIHELENIVPRIEKDLKECPSGTLYVSQEKEFDRYYCKDDNTGKKVYLSKDQSEKIRDLEQKKYLVELDKSVKNELAFYRHVLAKAEKIEDRDSVFLKLEPKKRHLIQPYKYVDNEKIIKKFMSFRDMSHVDNSSYKTIKGEYVRSKSELIIADRLLHYEIPYLYEPAVQMGEGGKTWLPDFYVMNKNTAQTFLWEHFGMLGNSEYCDKMHNKLEQYAECGIFIGKNLIITSESTAHQLNTDYVDRIIEQFLL